MKNVVVAGVLAAFVGLSSCHKEYVEINQTEPDPVLTDSLINTNQTEIISYFPLSVGNYWIYEQYEFDENGNQVGETGLDSIVVVGTEMVDGEEKFVVEYYEHPIQKQTRYLSNLSLFAKDSADNHLNEVFTLDLQTNNEGDTLMHMSKYMTKSPNTVINVPAGQFNDLLRYNFTVYHRDKEYMNTSDDAFSEYALGVGKIYQKYFYVSTYPKQYFERKLLKYHVK